MGAQSGAHGEVAREDPVFVLKFRMGRQARVVVGLQKILRRELRLDSSRERDQAPALALDHFVEDPFDFFGAHGVNPARHTTTRLRPPCLAA
jgi:hypothetical protein